MLNTSIRQRIMGRIKGKPAHEVGLKDESIAGFKAFWDKSASVDAEAAVAYLVDDLWQSGASELGMLRPYLEGQDTVVEIGCGIGRIMYHVAGACTELHGVDISAEMIKKAGQNLRDLPNVQLHVGNGYELPLPDASFDLAYSCRVFQHIPKNIALNYLKEVHRILKPGKKFALQIPNILIDEHMHALNEFSSEHYFENPYPMHFYTPAEIERIGRFVGFEVEVVDDWLLAILTKPA